MKRKYSENKILTIDTDVKKYKNQFEKECVSNIFFTKVFKATTDPIIPELAQTQWINNRNKFFSLIITRRIFGTM